MAKKENLSSSSSGLDDFEMPNFDFDSPLPKDDRTPITKFASGAISGAKSTSTNPAFIRKVLKASLPEGYGQAMDFADDVSKNTKQLYNNAAREIKPSLAEMARAAEKLAPASAKGLKSSLDKIGRWADESAKKYTSEDQGNQREKGIAAAMTQTFKFQMEENARNIATQSNSQRLRDGLDMSRHRDMFGILNSVNKGVSRLSQYQDKVTAVFQRKTLEIQYRQFYVAMDALEEAKKSNTIMVQQLAAITKNTSLPDFVKLSEGDRLEELLRTKLADRAGSLFGNQKGIIKKTTDHIEGVISDSISSMVGAFSAAASGMGMAADVMEMNKSMGMSKATAAGEALGSFGLDALAGKAGSAVRKRIDKNGKISLVGQRLRGVVGNTGQTMTEFKNSNKFENNDSVVGKLGKLFKLLIPDLQADKSLSKDTAMDLNKPFVYTKQTHKTINEVIPGYLSRIFRELQVMRTGDLSIGLTSYDTNKNKFLDNTAVSKNALSEIISGRKSQELTPGQKLAGKKPQEQSESVSYQLESIFKDIDPEGKLSQPARLALAKKLLKDNSKNRSGKAERMTDKDTFASDPETAKHAKVLTAQMKKYFGKASNTAGYLNKENNFTEKFNNLGSGIEDTRNVIQNMINLGQYDILEELGIINKDQKSINFDKMIDYHTGEAYEQKNDKLAPNGSNKFKTTTGRAPVELAKQKTASNPTGQVIKQPRTNNAGLIKAIEQSSSKEATQEAAECLKRLEQLMGSGFSAVIEKMQSATSNETGSVSTSKTGNIFNGASVNFGNLFKKSAGLVGGAFKLGNKISMSGLHGAGKVLGLAKDFAAVSIKGVAGLLGAGLNKTGGLRDLYTSGISTPRIEAVKLAAGRYKDMVTGKIVTTYEEIKGDVYDLDLDRIAITAEELKTGFFKSNAAGGIINIGKTLFSKVGQLMSISTALIPGAFNLAMGAVKGTITGLRNLLDEPVDVYVVGSTQPSLLSIIMRGGGYFNTDGTEVERPSQIKGPVLNEQGDIVLSLEQLKKGIIDKNGKPIRTALGKLLAFGKGILKAGLRIAKAGFNFGTKLLRGGVNLLRGGLKGVMKGIGGNTASSSDAQVNILAQIYNLLDQRLPSKGKAVGSIKNAIASKTSGGVGAATSVLGAAAGAANAGTTVMDVATGVAGAKAAWDIGKGVLKGNKTLVSRGAVVTAGTAASAGGLLASGAKGLFNLGRIGTAAAGYAFDGLLGKLGVGKDVIDTEQDDVNWSKMTVLEKAQSSLGRGIEKTAKLLFLDNVANEAIANRIKQETQILGDRFKDTDTKKLDKIPENKKGVSIDTRTDSSISATGDIPVYRSSDEMDSIEGIRMRTYGLTTMEQNKVSSIRQLEDYIISKVMYSGNGSATWKGSLDEALAEGGKFFAVSESSSTASLWKSWFKSRFLPVFLSYLGLVKEVTGNAIKEGIIPTLTPKQALAIGNQISTTGNVWSLSDSPWPDYKLADNDSILKPIFNKLRDAVSKMVVQEEVLTTSAKGNIWKPLDTSNDTNNVVKNVNKANANVDGEDKGLGKDGGATISSTGSSGSANVVVAGGEVYDGRNASKYLTLAQPKMLDGMNPAFMKNFNGMVDEYGKLTGKSVQVNSGFRTNEQQAAMVAKFGKNGAAPVGSSLHQYGLALDVATQNLDHMDKLGLLGKYGFTRPVGGEPWHLESIGTQSDTTGFKGNPTLASQAIANSLGKGGGGIGSIPGSLKGSRDGLLSERILNSNTTPKDNKVAEPVIPGSSTKANTQKATVSTPTYDALGNMTGSVDTEPVGGGGTIKGAPSLAGSSNASASTAFAAMTPGTGGQYSKLPESTGQGWAGNKELIVAAAKMAGVDPKLAASVTAIESNFNPMAKASSSSASGLNQFIDSTWKESMDKNASKYGIPANATQLDPKANALLGAEYLKANISSLGSVKKNVTGTDAYLAHFLGVGGAKTFLSSDPNAIAANILPAAAKSNPSIFYAGNNPRTISGVYNVLNTKMQSALQKNGVGSEFSSAVTGLDVKPSTTSTTTSGQEAQYDALGNMTSNGTPVITSSTPSQGTAQRPSFASTVSPMTDIGGINMNSTPTQVQQNPRADMNSAMAAAIPIMQQQLDVQTQIRDMIKTLITNGPSSASATQAPANPAVSSDGYVRKPEAKIPVPMSRT